MGDLTLVMAVFVLGVNTALAQSAVTLLSVATYANFQAAGVVATVGGDDNRNAVASLEWRVPGDASFRAGHPLARIDATHFAGSLFGLGSGRTYEVRVTLSDPDGVAGSPQGTTLQTRADTLPEPTLRTLYVSPAGSDLNPGTDPAAPLRTIQRAANLAQAGDLALIQPGVYRESVNVPSSGTATQPIVFRGNGTGVILDGADEAIAAGLVWAGGAGGVYSLVTGFPTGHVVANNARLYQYSSLADLQALAAGAPGGFFFDGATLYVRFPDNSSPQSSTMHVARFEDGFFLDGRAWVRIENMEIRHFGAASFGKGVYLRQSSDVVVRANRIHGFQAAGVWLKGGDRNRVEDNDIWDTSIFGWPWSLVKGSSAENNAIVLTDDIGRGNVIRRNTIHGTFNGIAPCGSLPPPGGVTNETDLYDNILFQHTDDAFEPEGYCANVRLWGNRVTDVHMAFAVAPAAVGPVYILRNVAYRFGNTRTSVVDGHLSSALKINSGYATPIGPLYLYHNTFLTEVPGTDAVALMNPGNSTFIRARNNVMAGAHYALWKVNPVLLDWDYDDLYTTDGSRFIYWEGTRYDTLGAFQAATGQELGGITAPPALVNPAGGDFRPAPGSPLVDRGVLIPGINDSYAGAAPDIGAFEAAAAATSTLVAAVLPSSRSVPVGTPATAFATIINGGASAALDCAVAPLTSLPATFSYQTTDPATNQLTGTPDTPVAIPAGAAQSFVFALTPNAAIAPTEVAFNFDCSNTGPAASTVGVNTLLLSASATPVPDIVALAATVGNDGIVNVPGPTGTGVFGVATVNVAAGGAITVTADTGGVTLPLTVALCETNPTTGACLAPPAAGVATTLDANATRAFAVFVAGGGVIPFDPATNRIFVRFRDAGGVVRGATSVAVRSQ